MAFSTVYLFFNSISFSLLSCHNLFSFSPNKFLLRNGYITWRLPGSCMLQVQVAVSRVRVSKIHWAVDHNSEFKYFGCCSKTSNVILSFYLKRNVVSLKAVLNWTTSDDDLSTKNCVAILCCYTSQLTFRAATLKIIILPTWMLHELISSFWTKVKKTQHVVAWKVARKIISLTIWYGVQFYQIKSSLKAVVCIRECLI